MTGASATTTVIINGTPYRATVRITQELLDASQVDLSAVMGQEYTVAAFWDAPERHETEENGKTRDGSNGSP